MAHKEISIGGGITCDEGVAPLVEALNSIPGVRTTWSCEDDGDWNGAVVGFEYGDTWQELGGLIQELSAQLESEETEFYNYSFTLRWVAGGSAHAVLNLDPAYIATLARDILQASTR